MAGVHYLCRTCEWRLVARAGTRGEPCENCGTDHAVVAPPAGAPVERCAACGEREMYVQKDFNRATGIALVVFGAAFLPFLEFPWNFVPLVVVTIVDFILYRVLRDVTVCYACRAVHRGYPNNPLHGPFDLVTHDRHVYGEAPPGAEEGHR